MFESKKTLALARCDSLLLLSTPLLVDARVGLGLSESPLDCGIRPVVPFSRMCGTAVTIRLEIARDKAEADLKLFDQAFRPNQEADFPIIVIQVPAELHGYGIVGGGMATLARAKGFVGALVEGAVRDTHDLRDMDFPAFSRTITPGYIVGKASAVELNQPVVIGGRTIHAGDVILRDNDGVVVIRPDELKDLLARAQEIKDWEGRVHGMLADGQSLEVAGPMP